MFHRLLSVFALALFAMPVLAQTENGPDFMLTTAGGNQLAIFSDLSPLAINRIHGWRLRLTTADDTPIANATISVNGGMPDHDHGLPTRPESTGEIEPGMYSLEGVRFHMPGRWLLTFSIVVDGEADSAIVEFTL